MWTKALIFWLALAGSASAELLAVQGLSRREESILAYTLESFYPGVNWRCRNESTRGPLRLVYCEPSPKPGFKQSRWLIEFDRRTGTGTVLSVVGKAGKDRHFSVIYGGQNE